MVKKPDAVDLPDDSRSNNNAKLRQMPMEPLNMAVSAFKHDFYQLFSL